MLLATCLPLSAQQPAYVATATDLKRDPMRESETLEVLPANTALTQLKRQGAWVQVQRGEQLGWVRMLVVRSGTPGVARKGESGLSRLFNLARSGSSEYVPFGQPSIQRGAGSPRSAQRRSISAMPSLLVGSWKLHGSRPEAWRM